MMKLLIVLVLVGVTAAAVVPVEDKFANRERYYHETIGIKEAARIKAAEEATDFFGVRIVGGSNAALGQFPYMGGLLVLLDTASQSVCGSSMLTSTRAVTAAHCWWDGRIEAYSVTIVYGSITLFSGGTRVTTRNVVMHPDWDPDRVENDVAVITHERVIYSNNIHPIGLASSNNLFVNAHAQAVGFGRQADNAGITYMQQLHYVTLQVISNEVCGSTFNGLLASNLCTSGYGGRAVCNGDSGGPLTVDQLLIGITSFGHPDGCQRGHPQAYARVTSYSSWIAARL